MSPTVYMNYLVKFIKKQTPLIFDFRLRFLQGAVYHLKSGEKYEKVLHISCQYFNINLITDIVKSRLNKSLFLIQANHMVDPNFTTF